MIDECFQQVNDNWWTFDGPIPRARLTGQVKEIASMEELLGEYEREEYYRR